MERYDETEKAMREKSLMVGYLIGRVARVVGLGNKPVGLLLMIIAIGVLIWWLLF